MSGRTRPVFVIKLTAKPGTDGIHALRRMLKFALRACGLRCISASEETPAPSPNSATAIQTARAFTELRHDVARRAARLHRSTQATTERQSST